MECLLPHLCMVTVPHKMVRLERMLDYRGVRLERFHCTRMCWNRVNADVMGVMSLLMVPVPPRRRVWS